MIFFNDSVKNAGLFRRVGSSIIVSVFMLNFGICSVKPAKTEEAKRFKFCDRNKSLFHLASRTAAKRKVRIAISDIEDSSNNDITNNGFSGEASSAQQPVVQFRGHNDILAVKLIKDNNFAVVNWNQIKPFYSAQERAGKLEAQKLVKLEKLREIRDKHGVEAVLIGTLNQFNVNGDRTRQFLGFGKKTDTNEFYIKLNFRVIDTSTGEIIFAAEGNSHNSKLYTSKVTIPKINVNITKGNTDSFNSGNTVNPWTNTKNDSIILTVKLGETTEAIKSRSENIANKLIALATENAINQIADKLNNHSERLACLLRKPTLLADIDKDKVILNKGRIHGYCEDLKLSIGRKVGLVKDPATGRIIHIKTKKLGEIKLTEVDSQFSTGVIISTSGDFNKVDFNFAKIEDLLVKPTNLKSCVKEFSNQ